MTFQRPTIEALSDELDFWNKLRARYQEKGTDIAQVVDDWAAEVVKVLGSSGAKEEFVELCGAGCLAKGLAALVFILGRVRLLDHAWTEMVGDPSNRAKTKASLEVAAQTLAKLYGGFSALETEMEAEHFAKMGRIPVSRLISELRFHVMIISLSSALSTDTEARSLEQVARYLVTSYVRQMTGDFHDRSVSALIAELLGSPDYNEVAHRMWRHRNYERLDKHYSWMANFLAVASLVVHHAT